MFNHGDDNVSTKWTNPRTCGIIHVTPADPVVLATETALVRLASVLAWAPRGPVDEDDLASSLQQAGMSRRTSGKGSTLSVAVAESIKEVLLSTSVKK